MKIQEQAKIIWDYLNIVDVPQKADVIFVLGGSTINPIKKAAKLFKADFASKIAFISIGGTFGSKYWKMSESAKYHQELLNLGIKENCILYDELSRNTLEEARLAIPFFKKNKLNAKKVILVSRPVHQRRAYATFAKQWPQIKFINCPADEKLTIHDKDLLLRLTQEIERLDLYGKKGDILVQKHSNKVDRAYKQLKNYLSKALPPIFIK